jgi:hypothetical protein
VGGAPHWRAGGIETRDLGVNDPWNASPTNKLPLDDPDYRLVWPRDLFVSELDAVLGRYDAQGSSGSLLLEEAFAGSSAVDEFRLAPGNGDAVIAELRRRAPELRELASSRSRPYYLHRKNGTDLPSEPDWDAAQRRYRTLMGSMNDAGYFDRAWGADCVDDHRDWRAPSDDVAGELGVTDLNPLATDTAPWDTDVFLSVVEVLHDRVARPRVITRLHDFGGCGRHYDDYAPAPGRAVYRIKVNKIFEQSRLPFRLADVGDDAGRVVAFSDDATEDLIKEAIDTAGPRERDEVRHAIAMFRARGADRGAKRSAIVALGRILELDRPLVKAELKSQDEGTLFRVMNEFDIRHSNDKQLNDYGTEFLDWVFWTHLASVRLLRHLKARAATQA